MIKYLNLVKFPHTIFALPFALLGYFIGVHYIGEFSWPILGLIILCMVFARNAAMGFNRYLDRDIDAANDRTQIREIPSGIITPQNALIFILINVALFVVTTYFINGTCFILSPVALLVILGYSYTKRFTSLCHIVLGIGLALAPVGAFIAVTEQFHLIPVLYGLVVLFWVSGFDIIYALQDEEFDRSQKLHSIPVRMGKKKALWFSTLLHLVSGMIVLSAGYLLHAHFGNLHGLHWIGAAIFIGLLIYQHTLVKPHDLSKVNLAFFTTNGYASVLFCALVIADFYL